MSQLKIRNLSLTEAKTVRIYRVSADGKIEVAPDEFTLLDPQGNSVGINLKSAYDVSCVGALPYVGVLDLVEKYDAGNVVIVTNGTKSVEVAASIDLVAKAIATQFELTVTTVLGVTDSESYGRLFIENNTGVNVDFMVITKGSIEFTNLGSEGAVVIDETKTVAQVCLAPAVALEKYNTNSRIILEQTNSKVIVKRNDDFFKTDAVGDKPVATMVDLATIKDNTSFRPDINNAINEARGDITITYDDYQFENLGLVITKKGVNEGAENTTRNICVIMRNLIDKYAYVQHYDTATNKFTNSAMIGGLTDTEVSLRACLSAGGEFIVGVNDGAIADEKQFMGNTFPLFIGCFTPLKSVSILNYPTDSVSSSQIIFVEATVVKLTDGYAFVGITEDSICHLKVAEAGNVMTFDFANAVWEKFSSPTHNLSVYGNLPNNEYIVSVGSLTDDFNGNGVRIGVVGLDGVGLDALAFTNLPGGNGFSLSRFNDWSKDNTTSERKVWLESEENFYQVAFDITVKTATVTTHPRGVTSGVMVGLFEDASTNYTGPAIVTVGRTIKDVPVIRILGDQSGVDGTYAVMNEWYLYEEIGDNGTGIDPVVFEKDRLVYLIPASVGPIVNFEVVDLTISVNAESTGFPVLFGEGQGYEQERGRGAVVVRNERLQDGDEGTPMALYSVVSEDTEHLKPVNSVEEINGKEAVGVKVIGPYMEGVDDVTPMCFSSDLKMTNHKAGLYGDNGRGKFTSTDTEADFLALFAERGVTAVYLEPLVVAK